MMKRIVKIVAALFLLAFIFAACSKTICPAYTIDSEAEPIEEVAKS